MNGTKYRVVVNNLEELRVVQELAKRHYGFRPLGFKDDQPIALYFDMTRRKETRYVMWSRVDYYENSAKHSHFSALEFLTLGFNKDIITNFVFYKE